MFEGEHFKTFISRWSYLPYEKIITHGKSTISIFAEFPKKFQMFAMKIDFE